MKRAIGQSIFQMALCDGRMADSAGQKSGMGVPPMIVVPHDFSRYSG
jgi:hypothetical protein